jgi:hypothetical protein
MPIKNILKATISFWQLSPHPQAGARLSLLNAKWKKRELLLNASCLFAE